jgi:HD-like signal output (HDOD) protein
MNPAAALPLLARVDQFPTLPDVVLRVSRALLDPEVDLPRVAGMIELDSALSAHLIRAANSPLFGGMSVDSVGRALGRLGTRQTRNVVITVGLLKTVPKLPSPYSVRSFWVLGLASAVVARRIAHDLSYPDPEQAYLAALVHCLGEAYLAIEYTERVRCAMQGWREIGGDFEDFLSREFGCEVPELTAGLLIAWNFPTAIVEAIRWHWYPDCAPAEQSLLASIVLAADRLCRDLGLGVADPGPDEKAWIEDVPPEFEKRLAERGYPDLTFYLLDLHDDLREVERFANSVFSG